MQALKDVISWFLVSMTQVGVDFAGTLFELGFDSGAVDFLYPSPRSGWPVFGVSQFQDRGPWHEGGVRTTFEIAEVTRAAVYLTPHWISLYAAPGGVYLVVSIRYYFWHHKSSCFLAFLHIFEFFVVARLSLNCRSWKSSYNVCPVPDCELSGDCGLLCLYFHSSNNR